MARISDGIQEQVEAIAERLAEGRGLELVEVEWKGAGSQRVLRVFVDRAAGVAVPVVTPAEEDEAGETSVVTGGVAGGVTVDDCATFSRDLSAALDDGNVIPDEVGYTLEVSSPGVERKLLKPRDFERFTGQQVKIVLKQPVANSKTWSGKLEKFADGRITLTTGGPEPIEFGLDDVSKANLKYDW